MFEGAWQLVCVWVVQLKFAEGVNSHLSIMQYSTVQ